MKRSGKSGFTLVEVIVSSFILSILFLSLAGAFNSNIMAVGTAKDMNQASIFMDTTLQSLASLDWASLLALNGNQFFNQTDATDSRYAINLSVFPSAIGLLQIRVVMFDLRNNQEIGRVVTHRSHR